MIMKKIFFPFVVLTVCMLWLACKKDIGFDVVDTTIKTTKNNAKSSWSFKGNGITYLGCIDTAYYSKIDSAKTLSIGLSDSAGNSIRLTFIAPRGVFSIGAYNTSLGTASIVVLTSSGNYTTTGLSTAFAAEITTLNDTLIEATFAAKLINPSNNAPFTINDGKLRALIGKNNVCGTPLTDSIAVYTLEGSGNNCSNALVQGNYTAGLDLTSANTVSLQANVTKKGQFSVTTSTVNGMSFSGSGIFPAIGMQTIVLTGSGKPLVSQTDSIPVTAGGTNCKFGVTATTGTGFPNAVFNAAASLCDSANVQGAYRVGTPLAPTNKIGIKVNVSTPGDYSITTSTVNGMTFFGVGSFATTGVQNVFLSGNGTPTTDGINKIPISIKNVNCNLSVRVDTSNISIPIPLNSWVFTEGANVFGGPVTVSSFAGDVITGKSLQIIGNTINGTDTAFQLYIQLPSMATVPVVGLYPTDPSTFSSNTTDFNFRKGDVFSTNKIYYVKSAAGTSLPISLAITIVNYDNAKRIVQGTFAGTVWNKAGASVTISTGMFKADVR